MAKTKSIYGYWRRGLDQYWHIKKEGALLINQPHKDRHYDGDAHIFFKINDSVTQHHQGREPITKEEFEAVKAEHIRRINEY